jgi:hypothetical protein
MHVLALATKAKRIPDFAAWLVLPVGVKPSDPVAKGARADREAMCRLWGLRLSGR